MTADTTATSEVAGGAGVSAAGKGFFYQPLVCATLHGQGDLVTVLNDTLRTLRGDGTLRRLSLHWYRGLDVGVRPTGVPSFTAALALLKAEHLPDGLTWCLAPSGDSARRIEPIVPARRWQVLSSAELDRLREAVFAVLADVGVRFPLPRALDVLAAHGAAVDRSRDMARLPRRLVRGGPWRALRASSPSAAASPSCDLPLDGRHCYLSNDASGVFVIDPASGERRASTLADVAASARFCDALPQVAFAWGPIVAAGDVPVGPRALHEAAAVLANTTKHFQAVTCVGRRPTRLLIEMAAALAGGADELRRRPLISLIACPVDPLGNDAVSLEAGLVCAAAGVPCGFLSLTLGCGTAPATLAGNLVVNAAAVLADLVLLQLASPGAPVFFAGAPSVMDLRSGGYTGGGPEDDVLAAAATQLGHSFGLPVNMGTMATGAKEPGWQAAVDDALSSGRLGPGRRRHDERRRPARRLAHALLSASRHGDRGISHRAAPRRGHRRRRRDARPGSHRPGGAGRHLPRRPTHAPSRP